MTEQSKPDPNKWPAWFYGPNGAAQIFNHPDDVPKGWADHPDKVKAAKAEKPADPTPPPADDLAALRAEYKAATGKRPSPGWKADKLRELIAAAKG